MFKTNHPMRRALFLISFAALALSIALKPERLGDAFSWVWGTLSCVTAGLCLAFVLNLIMVPLERVIGLIFRKHPKPKLTRVLSLALTFVIALGLLALIFFSILPSMRDIAQTIAQYLPNSLNDLPAWLENTMARLGLGEQIIQNAKDALKRLADYITDYVNDIGSLADLAFSITTGVFGGIVDVILTIALSVYVLADKEKLSRFASGLVRAYLPEKAQEITHELSELMYDKFSDFFKGQLIEALILGAACFIGMLIFGFPNAATISVLVGTSAIVPIIGPWVGTITGILLNLMISPLNGLFFAIFIIILQQVEDNVVYPRIVGRQMNVPGILVLACVIVGAEVYGMMGIIAAVPLGAVLFELLRRHMGRRLAAPGAKEA